MASTEKQVLETDFSKTLKRKGILFTRLRTPGYGFRGVKYPGDFVVWCRNYTLLVECKERKELPIAPSNIRQLSSMEEWESKSYTPKARYCILVSDKSTGRYFVFMSSQAVKAKKVRKSLKADDAVFSATSIQNIVDLMIEEL